MRNDPTVSGTRQHAIWLSTRSVLRRVTEPPPDTRTASSMTRVDAASLVTGVLSSYDSASMEMRFPVQGRSYRPRRTATVRR